jgi:hypothetical protein
MCGDVWKTAQITKSFLRNSMYTGARNFLSARGGWGGGGGKRWAITLNHNGTYSNKMQNTLL